DTHGLVGGTPEHAHGFGVVNPSDTFQNISPSLEFCSRCGRIFSAIRPRSMRSYSRGSRARTPRSPAPDLRRHRPRPPPPEHLLIASSQRTLIGRYHRNDEGFVQLRYSYQERSTTCRRSSGRGGGLDDAYPVLREPRRLLLEETPPKPLLRPR